jgi:BON domain
MEQRDDRLPLPSEDGGDLVEEPPRGMTDDPLVATEEGVPYDPPTDRKIAQTGEPGGPDVAGVDPDPAGELEREDQVQPPDGLSPRDDELTADVVEALRASDVPAGDRIRVLAQGSRVLVRGEVESVDILDEILGIVGDVPGVDDVIDEVQVTGV